MNFFIRHGHFVHQFHLSLRPPSTLLSYLDSAAVSIFVVILVELTNTVFVNSTNIKTNIETAVLSKAVWLSFDIDLCVRLTRRVEMVSGSITRLRKSDPLISSTRQSRT